MYKLINVYFFKNFSQVSAVGAHGTETVGTHGIQKVVTHGSVEQE